VLSVDHNECRATAEGIEQRRPGWMVIWGDWTKGYTAYPLSRVPPGVILFGHTPEALINAIDDTERRYRIRPAKRTNGERRPES